MISDMALECVTRSAISVVISHLLLISMKENMIDEMASQSLLCALVGIDRMACRLALSLCPATGAASAHAWMDDPCCEQFVEHETESKYVVRPHDLGARRDHQTYGAHD